jgi:hypothetical protein
MNPFTPLLFRLQKSKGFIIWVSRLDTLDLTLLIDRYHDQRLVKITTDIISSQDGNKRYSSLNSNAASELHTARISRVISQVDIELVGRSFCAFRGLLVDS